MENTKKKSLKDWWTERTTTQKYLIIGGVVIFSMVGALTDDKSDNSKSTSNELNQTIEPSQSEKKVRCQRMYSSPDLTAWENAQAECLLHNTESACECMKILSQ